MEHYVKNMAPPAERAAAMRAMIRRMPEYAEFITESDVHRLADLILHAFDETINHMMGHVERAKIVGFQNEDAFRAFMPLLLKCMQMQVEAMLAEGLKRATEDLVAGLAADGELSATLSELLEELGRGHDK